MLVVPPAGLVRIDVKVGAPSAAGGLGADLNLVLGRYGVPLAVPSKALEPAGGSSPTRSEGVSHYSRTVSTHRDSVLSGIDDSMTCGSS